MNTETKLSKYKSLLREFVALKSVSTDKEFAGEMRRAVEWLKNQFENGGFKVQTLEGYGNPVVFAFYEANPDFDTCLVYGHYDAQPAHVEDGWDSDPFVLTERDNRLFARGVVDNKGQVLIHIVNIIELIKQGRLNYNIKFLIEGDEETGSGSLDRLIKDYKELLKADFALLSDGEFGKLPTIEAGFRGGFNCTLTVKTSYTDLHSGIYGTGAPNAAHELAKLMATFYDEQHQIKIKGFYDDVDEIDEQIRKTHLRLPFDHSAHLELTGTRAVLTEPEYDFYTQTGLRPSIQVTGLRAGFTGQGYRNSIAGQAHAKINFRLVKSQSPEKVARLFEEHIKLHLSDWAEYNLEFHDFHEGVKLDLDNKYTKVAVKAITKSHGQKPVFKFCGGGLPVVTHFDQLLNIPTLSVSLGNDDCAMHAANENFRLDYIEQGLKFSGEFFEIK